MLIYKHTQHSLYSHLHCHLRFVNAVVQFWRRCLPPICMQHACIYICSFVYSNICSAVLSVILFCFRSRHLIQHNLFLHRHIDDALESESKVNKKREEKRLMLRKQILCVSECVCVFIFVCNKMVHLNFHLNSKCQLFFFSIFSIDTFYTNTVQIINKQLYILRKKRERKIYWAHS